MFFGRRAVLWGLWIWYIRETLCFVASCSVNDVGGKLAGISSTRDDKLAIFTDFKIPGVLTTGGRKIIGWEIQTTGSGEVNLGILRNRNNSDTDFTVVGTTMKNVSAAGHDIFDLVDSEQIEAWAGDVIGLIYSDIIPVGEGVGVDEEYKSRVFVGDVYSLSMGASVTVTPEAMKQTIAVRAILEPSSGECQRTNGLNGDVVGGPSVHGLTLILAWINNYFHYELWYEITYPYPNLHRWSLGMDT